MKRNRNHLSQPGIRLANQRRITDSHSIMAVPWLPSEFSRDLRWLFLRRPSSKLLNLWMRGDYPETNPHGTLNCAWSRIVGRKWPDLRVLPYRLICDSLSALLRLASQTRHAVALYLYHPLAVFPFLLWLHVCSCLHIYAHPCLHVRKLEGLFWEAWEPECKPHAGLWSLALLSSPAFTGTCFVR